MDQNETQNEKDTPCSHCDVSSEASAKEETELKKCLEEKDEYLKGWQRSKADFVNYKKEESSRIESLMKFGNEAFIREFVMVLDSFELGFAAMQGNEAAEKGMRIVKSQCEEILKKHGLEKIIVEQGERFNPQKHEAMLEVESELGEGKVVSELERGYMLYGKVIRPAKVKVSKGQGIK